MRTRDWIAGRRREELESHAEDTDDHRYFRKAWSIAHGALVVTGWMSGFGGEFPTFKRRDVVLIVSMAGETVARATFGEWKAKDWLYEWDDFVVAADEASAIDLECAEVIRQYWDDDDWPFEYGNLVIFDRLSIPKPHKDIWPSLDAAIKHQFHKNGSIMVLKAFPLEWEGQGETDGDPVFARRLEAMKRLYASKLGVTSFRGAGNEDWMWKSLRYCPEPFVEPNPQPALSLEEFAPLFAQIKGD
jgi:hypothetical protein